MQHHVHLRTDVGKERERNEDHAHSFQREDGVWILIVCDGMGGHDGGEIASHVAVETLTEFLSAADNNDPAQAIEDALRAANTAVVNTASPQGGLDMGTTAVVAWVENARFWFGWVGDSRLFHWRGDQKLNGSIDHTRVQVMVDLGLLSPDQVRGHPDSHILMQALGGGPAAQQSFLPSVIRDAIPLLKGDFLLLCSDGLHDLVDDTDLLLNTTGKSVTQATQALIDAALEKGGHDNITVVVLIADQDTIPELLPEQKTRLLASRPPPLRTKDLLLPPLMAGLAAGVLAGVLLGWWLQHML